MPIPNRYPIVRSAVRSNVVFVSVCWVMSMMVACFLAHWTFGVVTFWAKHMQISRQTGPRRKGKTNSGRDSLALSREHHFGVLVEEVGVLMAAWVGGGSNDISLRRHQIRLSSWANTHTQGRHTHTETIGSGKFHYAAHVRDNQIHWEIKKKMSKRKAENRKTEEKKTSEKRKIQIQHGSEVGEVKVEGISEGSSNRKRTEAKHATEKTSQQAPKRGDFIFFFLLGSSAP